MSDLSVISQAALGTTSAVQLSTLFSTLKGGNTYAVKAPVGNSADIVLGVDNTVTATTGWPLSKGDSVTVDGGSLRKLWVIGASADRIAVMVLS